MFVRYDEQAVAQAETFTPAFQAGWYPAKATGFAQEQSQGQGGPKVVITFEVWAAAQRGAATRTVKAHFCLQHPKPQARGMFHARLRDLGLAAGTWDQAQVGTNIAGTVGKWVLVELTREEGTNRQGNPTAYNNIDGFARFEPAAQGPAAPGAGVPQDGAAALGEALAGVPGITGVEQRGADVGYAPQATADQYQDASAGLGDRGLPPDPGHDSIPF